MAELLSDTRFSSVMPVKLSSISDSISPEISDDSMAITVNIFMYSHTESVGGNEQMESYKSQCISVPINVRATDFAF